MGMTIKCPTCGQKLGNTNSDGDVSLKVRGVVLKKDGTVVVFCKSCYKPFYPRRSDLAKKIGDAIGEKQRRAVLDEREIVV